MSRRLINSADIIILGVSLLFLIWLYQRFWFQGLPASPADTLVVQVGNEQPENYPLTKDQVITIKGSRGDSLIEIKAGKARFIHSVCRNKFCIIHGWLTTPGDIVACLPNQISISLKAENSEYDAINY